MSEAFVLQAGDVTGTSRSLPIRSLARGLALAMIFTIPWEVGVTLGSVGRISRALGLAVAAVWILSVLLAGVRRPGPVQKAYVAFVLWSGATYFWSVDPTASLLQAVTYVQLLGMVLLLWDLFDTERAVRAALQAYVYGSFVTAGSVIVQFLTSPPARFAEHARYIGLGTEIDGIGLIVAAAAPAAWYLAMGPGLGEGSRWRRWVDLAYSPTAFFALILTGTRGAALASIPTVVLMIWSLRRLDPVMRRTGAAALGVTFVLVLLFAPPEMLARVGSVWSALTGSETTAQWNVEDVGGRAETWGGAFAAFSERPIQGVGTDAIRATIAVQYLPVRARGNRTDRVRPVRAPTLEGRGHRPSVRTGVGACLLVGATGALRDRRHVVVARDQQERVALHHPVSRRSAFGPPRHQADGTARPVDVGGRG